MTQYTSEELLERLREWIENNLDIHPAMKTISKDPSMPSERPYLDKWGKWSSVLKKVGYDKTKLTDILRIYTDEELLFYIKDFYSVYGRVPTTRNITDFGFPNRGVYEKRFGSWAKAVEKAGFQSRRRKDRGPNHFNYKNGTCVDDDGYRLVLDETHNCKAANNYIHDHVVVAEKKYGRKLDDNEVVHHLNEDRLDNRPENIVIVTRAEHMNIHRDVIANARREVGWSKKDR